MVDSDEETQNASRRSPPINVDDTDENLAGKEKEKDLSVEQKADLINRVRLQPPLWKKDSHDYRNNKLKDRLWENILKEMKLFDKMTREYSHENNIYYLAQTQ